MYAFLRIGSSGTLVAFYLLATILFRPSGDSIFYLHNIQALFLANFMLIDVGSSIQKFEKYIFDNFGDM